MSVLTSRNIVTLPIPHDAGQSFTFRQLAPRHLERAAKEAQRASIADFREMGGAAVLKELQSLTVDQLKAEAERDPLLSYDRVTLIEAAVQSWTYDFEMTRENIADLDEATQDFMARAILQRSRPSLFQTADEQEADRKND